MFTVFPSSFPIYSESSNDIKHYWIFKQETTISKYKTSKTKERRDERRNKLDKEKRQQRCIDRMFEQMNRQREIQLMQSLNSMTMSSIFSLQQQSSSSLSSLSSSSQYMQYSQYQQWSQWSMPSSHFSTFSNIYVSLSQHSHQQQQNSNQHHTAESRSHKSSSLEDDEKKKKQVVDDFWTWRINKINNSVSRQRLIDAKIICDEQAWRRLSDIQQLVITISDIFKKTMKWLMKLLVILLKSFISSNIYIAWFIDLLTIYKIFKGKFRVSKQKVLCYSK